jgi:aromatic ring hydroxylase
MNSALTALASATTFFKDVDPAYGERIRAYYEFASHNDLLATHTLVPPQVNRSVVASQQAGGRLTARIVEERGNGVVVRGARLLATLGPNADELLVFPSTVLRGTPEDEIEKALLRAAEADGELSEDGVFLPQWSTLNAARNWYPRKVSQRLPEIIRKFSASGLMALPGEADFALAAREGRADLDTYLQAATATAQQRARLFKLALDAAVSGFAGREALYEYFFFGDPVRMAEAQVGGYDREPARARVRALLADADADAR